MSGVIAATLLYVPPASGFAVPEAARIVIFHVPCAMIAVIGYLVSTVYAIAFLIKGNVRSDLKSAASAGLGFMFTALAAASGMVFARIEWGSAWNWDPRETSIGMLLIVYAAYFALRSSVPGRVARAKISAVYNIMACLVMPYFVFVMPRMLGGLHPSHASLSPEYRIALMGSAVGFLWLYIWVLRVQVRAWERGLARGTGKSGS